VETGWNKADLHGTPDALKALQQFQTSAKAVVDIVETVVSVAKTILELVLKVTVDMKDLEAIALKAAVAAMRTILKDLTESASAYFLFVPIRATDPYAWTGDPKFFYIGGSTSFGLPVLQTLPGPNSISQPSGGAGGNFGFYSQVAQSLQDAGDIMRPQFTEDAYVASMVFLAGADPANLSNLLILAQKLQRLWGNAPWAVLTPPDMMPVPSNFRATLIPAPPTGLSQSLASQWLTAKPEFTTQPYAVRLDWDRPKKNWTLTAYGNVEFELTHITLWRWGAQMYSVEQAQAMIDLGSGDVTESWSTDDELPLKVKRWEFDGISPLYFIDPTIQPGKTYQYGISYKINGHDQPIVSLRMAIPARITLSNRSGVPPDWFAANVFSLIPGLGSLVAKLNAWMDGLEAQVTTESDDLKKFVQFLEDEMTRYSNWIRDMGLTIQQLIDALTWPSVYIGIWNMEPGKGGNDYFLQQLGKGLFNPLDDNRPPFDLGSELVCGFVMYTGSESYGALQKFATTIDLLFGGFVGGTKNAFLTASEELGVLNERLQQDICLTEALVKKTCEEVVPKEAAMSEDLRPAVEDCGCTTRSPQPQGTFER